MHSKQLRSRGRMCRSFQHSKTFIKQALRLTTVDKADFTHPIEEFTEQNKPRKLKSLLQQVLRQNDNMLTFRTLRETSMSRCFTSGAHHPLLQLSGRLYTNYISWLVGTATSAEIPEFLRKQSQKEKQEEERLENLMDNVEESGSQPGDDELIGIHSDICRACRKDLETRLHLLSVPWHR